MKIDWEADRCSDRKELMIENISVNYEYGGILPPAYLR